MIESQFPQIDRKTWNKWLFYINILVFIIIAVSIYFIIIDSYAAGKLASQPHTGDALSQAWLIIARDIAFIAVCFTYIFFQLFKYQRIIIRRTW